MGASPAEVVAERLEELRDQLTGDERRELLSVAAKQRHRWPFWARSEQRQPAGTDWQTWVYLAGRGSGKTRAGAEFMLDRSEQYHAAGVKHRAGLIGRTAADVRDTMVEGASGIMACLDRRKVHGVHQPGRRRILIPKWRTEIHTYTAMEPESLRGPEHHTIWADEVAAWRQKVDDQGNTAWTNAMFGLRLDAPGLIPRVMASTTPKAIPLVREWMAAVTPCGRTRGHEGIHTPRPVDTDPNGPKCGHIDPSVVMTRGALHDNIAHLAASFVRLIVERYKDSPLGAQEIFGALLDRVEGALWDMARLEGIREHGAAPAMARIIVAVDPPAKWDAECGIIVLGIESEPRGPHGRPRVWVLDDMSMRGRAEDWGAQVITAVRKYAAATVVAEDNQGGDMVRATIQLQDASVPYQSVTAKVSKWERAEPVAAAYADRVRHLGFLADLESQMTTWTEDDDWSPDRMDALVHGVRHLLPEIVTVPAQFVSPAAMPRFGGSRRIVVDPPN